MQMSASIVSSLPGSGSWISSVFGTSGGAEIGPGKPNVRQFGFWPVSGSGAP